MASADQISHESMVNQSLRFKMARSSVSCKYSEFSMVVIPGHNHTGDSVERRRRPELPVIPPREKSMPIDQDWTTVWPTASTFKWSAVPLPIRQGRVFVCFKNFSESNIFNYFHSQKAEQDGIPPGKYGNLELMKIPNFLHLTPNHIKKHCAALKEFCTEWPEGLETDEKCKKHFPVEVISSDYIVDSISLRDPRARTVCIKINLSSLDLDSHAKDKFIRLVGDRYNADTGELTLELDRCPMKKQNHDYGIYLLSALFKESWKTEGWESEKTVDDMEMYVWSMNESKKNTQQITEVMKKAAENPSCKVPEYVLKSENVLETEPVQEYAAAVEDLHNVGEDLHSLEKYKEQVKKMLLAQ
ncbi:hypothetical protein CAPTEDRAFT_184915 [Capitella teleta]|uniref:Small ribosomal subunit protein mS35 mitochondrial conserved domain-containing protein n=1 Tax=Capitella teleta TaxID=283909 RepID=X1ZH84_CAPTE|nr:hypothetical protein CAPTEDRAFT_184915 [Capitella teleta]|eukprot:ELT90129.1 hypothetical protein CAPTEDRAFT_184915 [Capitella teleta]